ncbi:MAG: OsmC family protein [Fimbriimonadaceae bacterium]|nr:OsmC family protein [Fimbriimonadaceae bacterium]QYK56397.1 MAG: OsmC family protein [Fimbriimonadaceae bacterium]
MDIKLDWKGDLRFEAHVPTGNHILFDTYPDEGVASHGPTPMETVLASVAACTGMDVISILMKKRQSVTGYRLEIHGERTAEGEYPRPFTKMTVRHIIEGEDIDPGAVQRAIELSEEKYCSVAATLRRATEIHSEWEVAGKPLPA